MGGPGSGNWYRFDKRTTTGECHSVDVRYLHREGLLKPGPWFVCPGAGCGRRVAVLYGPGRYFLCRHCCDLVYESQRENGVYRALHRAQSIRERLGGSASMMAPFPEKPKGMHHETYWRLREEHDEAEMEQFTSMREWLDRLEKKVG
jgi:hypothetical protein